MGFWERWKPQRAAEVAARKTYAVAKRGSTSANGTPDDYVLKFYPRSDSSDLVEIHFDELQTGHSDDDNWQKWSSTTFLVVLFALPVFAGFYRDLSGLQQSHPVQIGPYASGPSILYYGVLFAVATVVIVCAVLVDSMLRVNFKDMDNGWRTAIREFLDNDLQNKFEGIRACMLSFRRFVKWRRYMTYVWWTFWFLAVLEFSAIAISPWLTTWNTEEIAFAIFFLLLQAGAVLRYSYLRWYHTDFRDPTLQLCVMLAEQNREYVGLLHRAGRV
jgi:hypothetical protein